MVLLETNLRFEFTDDSWFVIKYDEHAFYRQKFLKSIPKSKAVDFVGIHNNKLYLWEIKNYRHHGREEEVRAKLTAGAEKLCSHIAKKVRDTISGLVGISRMDENNQLRRLITEQLLFSNDIFVIAWIEEDFHPRQSERERKVLLQTRRSKLKAKLSWLNANVILLNSQDWNHILPGFSFSFGPGA